jgi:hypothetical protein
MNGGMSIVDVLCWQVGGFAVLGIGIYAHESDYGSRAVGGLIGVALYSVDSTMFIASGSVTICIMAIGLFGYLLPQKCLLGLVCSRVNYKSALQGLVVRNRGLNLE